MADKPIPAFSFDFLTPFYDFLANLVGYGETQRVQVINLLHLQAGEHLLDVGCGTGALLLTAKKKLPGVYMEGIDIDEKILKIAERKIKKDGLDIKLKRTSADELPFKDSSFDAVVSTLIFHHLPTRVKIGTLKEIYRILKPKGRFLLADFGENAQIFKILSFLNKFIKIPETTTAKDNVEGNIPLFLKESGFKTEKAAPRYLGIDFIKATK